MADGDRVQTSIASSLRAVDTFRSTNSVPEACNLDQAGFVASLVLEDVDGIRRALDDRIEHTVAGTPARTLAARLAEVERLAFAAQRLRVEALSARLRYDLSTMERLSADVFFHVTEAGESIRRLMPVVDEVMDGPPPALSVVDVEPDPPPAPLPPSRIVAAALGLDHTNAPSIVPSGRSPGSRGSDRSVDASAAGSPTTPADDPEPEVTAWTPPTFVPPEPRPGPFGRWFARRRHLRAERKMIRSDEKQRGRGLRPRLPTWLSQALATVVVVLLVAVVVIGAWMLLVSDAGPF